MPDSTAMPTTAPITPLSVHMWTARGETRFSGGRSRVVVTSPILGVSGRFAVTDGDSARSPVLSCGRTGRAARGKAAAGGGVAPPAGRAAARPAGARCTGRCQDLSVPDRSCRKPSAPVSALSVAPARLVPIMWNWRIND
ncbi:hypothetical protein GCM10022205_51810 [Spinactinospora alkalitolerans]